jgi:hypothetical protein
MFTSIRSRTARLTLAALAAVAVLTVACSSSHASDPTTTPAPTGEATATSVPASPTAVVTPVDLTAETNNIEGIRNYVEAVDAGLQKGQTGILTSRLTATVGSGTWRSEGGVVPGSVVAALIQNFAANAKPDMRDQYGDGAAKVWGFGNIPSNAHIVITAITSRVVNGKSEAPARAAIDVRLTYCEQNCPTAKDTNRWTITSVTSAFVLAEDWLFLTVEGRNFLGSQYEVYHRPLKTSPEQYQAAAAVAAAFGNGVKADPDCSNAVSCIMLIDPGTSVDLGIMRLAFRAPIGEGGGAAIFAGKEQDGTWGFWFGTQQAIYRAVDLPGDIMICAGADVLNVRSAPAKDASLIAAVKTGDKVHAEQFVLTEPATSGPGGTNGAGWYRVSGPLVPNGGWVYSRYTTDARLGSCQLHDQIEKP